VSEPEMRRQNARWKRDTRCTDVLSFDLRSRRRRGEVDGQLILCEAVARREARARGHDWRAELVLYAVHGCLHLCGHDDRRPADAARMHRLEDRILTLLGWGRVFAGGRSVQSVQGAAARARRRA